MRHHPARRFLVPGGLCLALLVATSPSALTAPVPTPPIGEESAPPAPPKGEGMIHLKRGINLVDVDSLIDPSKPDFFLHIDLSGQPTPAPVEPLPPSPEVTSVPTPEPTVEPTVVPTVRPEPSPLATPSVAPERPVASPTPETNSSLQAMYQAQRLARQGQYRQALEAIDQGLAVDEAAAPLHAIRGSLSFKLGDTAGAQAAWTRALELDPGMEDVRAALQWLNDRSKQGGNR